MGHLAIGTYDELFFDHEPSSNDLGCNWLSKVGKKYKYENLSPELKKLFDMHPYVMNGLLNSEYVLIDELAAIAKESFNEFEPLVMNPWLVNFVIEGVLPLNQLLVANSYDNLNPQLYGAIKEGLLSKVVSFEVLAQLSGEQLASINQQNLEGKNLEAFVFEALVYNLVAYSFTELTHEEYDNAEHGLININPVGSLHNDTAY